MAVLLTRVEREIISCSGCKAFKKGMLRSAGRKLTGRDPIIWTIHNGNGTKSAPVHVQIVACRIHEVTLIERGGWDGTGRRQ